MGLFTDWVKKRDARRPVWKSKENDRFMRALCYLGDSVRKFLIGLLVQAHMSSSNPKLPSVALRMRAGQMLVDGEAVTSVASQLGISIATVKRYQSAIEQNGLVALERIGVGGRKSALDANALAWIAGTLRESPIAHGFDTDQWSDGRLKAVIEQRFGVRFSRVYVRQLAINLGFSDKLRRTKGTGPSSPVLNSEALSWIAAALRHSPRIAGFDADRWSNGRLRIAIERRFGVSYSRTHVWKIATDLGLSHLISKARK